MADTSKQRHGLKSLSPLLSHLEDVATVAVTLKNGRVHRGMLRSADHYMNLVIEKELCWRKEGKPTHQGRENRPGTPFFKRKREDETSQGNVPARVAGEQCANNNPAGGIHGKSGNSAARMPQEQLEDDGTEKGPQNAQALLSVTNESTKNEELKQGWRPVAEPSTPSPCQEELQNQDYDMVHIKGNTIRYIEFFPQVSSTNRHNDGGRVTRANRESVKVRDVPTLIKEGQQRRQMAANKYSRGKRTKR